MKAIVIATLIMCMVFLVAACGGSQPPVTPPVTPPIAAPPSTGPAVAPIPTPAVPTTPLIPTELDAATIAKLDAKHPLSTGFALSDPIVRVKVGEYKLLGIAIAAPGAGDDYQVVLDLQRAYDNNRNGLALSMGEVSSLFTTPADGVFPVEALQAKQLKQYPVVLHAPATFPNGKSSIGTYEFIVNAQRKEGRSQPTKQYAMAVLTVKVEP